MQRWKIFSAKGSWRSKIIPWNLCATRPRDTDWNEVKRVLRYFKGTRNLKLQLSSTNWEKHIFAIITYVFFDN